jgi:hypothetical protein
MDLMLKGTLPRNKYDGYSLSTSSTIYTYKFSYDGVSQFKIDVDDPASNSMSTSVTELNNLLTEDRGMLLLEDGGELLLEG